jgi:xylulokinase
VTLAAPAGPVAYLGVDIGTGSTKGSLVDADGTLLATVTRPHATSSPHPGHFEHDPDAVWWADVVAVTRALLTQVPAARVAGVAVSGIGPAVLLTDDDDVPLRPAILYGIDTRSEEQVDAAQERFGREALLQHAGNLLSTQSVGPKLDWVREHEPQVWARARRLYSAPGWVVRRLSGAYTMDHYSASGSDPLYDLRTQDWWDQGWTGFGRLARPQLSWPGEVVGRVLPAAAEATGLPAGIPVLAGTIDALAEAYSVGCRSVGDLMVMYGSTMFLVQTVAEPAVDEGLWAAVGREPGTFACAAGMSTSGLITSWLTEVVGADFPELIAEARRVPAGSDGLLLLPYFAGERTPIFDPQARGAWIGLTLRHTRGHLYRSVLEAVAMGVRHNVEAMSAAGATPTRLVAVGGGTREDLWSQIVSDVTGLPQEVPSITVGASYGDARMVADALGVDTAGWNPVARRVEPCTQVRPAYDLLYAEYLAAYPALAPTMHALGALAG